MGWWLSRPATAVSKGRPGVSIRSLALATQPPWTEFIAADKLRTDSDCVVRWDRTIMRPLER